MSESKYDDITQIINHQIFLHNSKLVSPKKLDDSLPFKKEKIMTLQSDIMATINHKGPLNIKQLALELNSHASSISRTVCELEKKGLLQLFKKADDRRNTYVRLTDKADAMARENNEVKLRYVLDSLYTYCTPEEIEKFYQAYLFIIEILDRFDD